MQPPGAPPMLPGYDEPVDGELPVPIEDLGPEYGVQAPIGPQPSADFVPTSGEPPSLGPPEALVYGAPRPMHDVYGHQAPWPVMTPHLGQPTMAQAVGQLEHEQAHTLGLSMLAVAVGMVVGAKQGGMVGAAAGTLFAGAAVNVLRAFSYYQKGTDEGDREGRVSVIYGLLGALGGGVLWFKYVKKPLIANPGGGADEEGSGPCSIRPAGP